MKLRSMSVRFYLVFGLVLLILMTALGCNQSASTGGYTDVTASEAKALIDENPDLIVIDVSPDYISGHIPGAVHYYFGDGSLTAAIPILDKSKTYLVYCTNSVASTQASQKLVDEGFNNVYRLEGNFQSWVDAGYPVERTY